MPFTPTDQDRWDAIVRHAATLDPLRLARSIVRGNLRRIRAYTEYRWQHLSLPEVYADTARRLAALGHERLGQSTMLGTGRDERLYDRARRVAVRRLFRRWRTGDVRPYDDGQLRRWLLELGHEGWAGTVGVSR